MQSENGRHERESGKGVLRQIGRTKMNVETTLEANDCCFKDINVFRQLGSFENTIALSLMLEWVGRFGFRRLLRHKDNHKDRINDFRISRLANRYR